MRGIQRAFERLGVGMVAMLIGMVGWTAQPTLKQQTLVQGTTSSWRQVVLPPGEVGGEGYRLELPQADRKIPVVIVRGTPYQMGYHLGRLIRPEIHTFLPQVLPKFKAALRVTDAQLREAWIRSAAYTDDRVEQELVGLADGAQIPIEWLWQVQCFPLLLPYSCSSIAVWGKATKDGHLYQTRDLDWNLQVKAHEFPVIVVYLPARGIPHVVPTFAGFVGATCGMNMRGIVLSEMGDSPQREAPYEVRAPHFTSWFRTILYDADRLSSALAIFRKQKLVKRYHFVFGDGQTEHRAVKIRLNAANPRSPQIQIWHDQDLTDEWAPHVLPYVVYQDEGRGIFPFLKAHYGQLDGKRMIEAANRIPIRGGNVMDVVFDATALRLWVSYAHGTKEAYQLPYVFLDLKRLDGDHDGIPDLQEGVGQNTSGGTSPGF